MSRPFRRSQSVQEDCDITAANGSLRKFSRQSARSRSSRRTSGSSVASSTSSSPLAGLSHAQRQQLLLSWRLLRPHAAPLARRVLAELEIACPKVKQIFYKAALVDAFNRAGDKDSATMDEHVRLLIKFFDDLMSIIEDDDEVRALINRVGAAHAVLARSCSFSADIWERLGEIAMERFCAAEQVQKTREAGRAWRALLACVVDELRSGFEEEHRLVSRRSSSSSELPDEVTDAIGCGGGGGSYEDGGYNDEPQSVSPSRSRNSCPYSRRPRTAEAYDDVAGLQGKLRELRMHYTDTLPL